MAGAEEEEEEEEDFFDELVQAAKAVSDAEGSAGQGQEDGDEEEEEDAFGGIAWTAQGTVELGAAAKARDVERADDDVVALSGEEAAAVKASRKRGRKRARTRTRIELVHRMDLLCHLGVALKLNRSCDAQGLQEAARSIMPEPFHRVETAKRLRLLTGWFAEWATVVENAGETSPESLQRVLVHRRGSETQLLLVFVAMLRAVGVPCRLVASLVPVPRLRAVESKRARRMLRYWAEVLLIPTSDDKGSARWMAVQPMNWLVDFDPKLQANEVYVVGIGMGDFTVDVTSRYAARWSQAQRARHSEKDGWWKYCVLLSLQERGRRWLRDAFGHLSSAQQASFELAVSTGTVAQEENQMEACNLSEDMPTSEQGFRKHAKFVLAKHLRKMQGVMPDHAAVGLFKGVQVFLRSAVAPLNSKTGWKRKGRVLKQGQEEHPVKLIDPVVRLHRRSKASKVVDEDKSQADEDDEDAEEAPTPEDAAPDGKIRLFGEWQTQAYVPPPVGADGKIPKNEYGNVEMWTSSCCPSGATHLRVDLAAQAASQLGIDFARALVGFEKRDMFSTPKFEGIVVADQFVTLVCDAASALQQQRVQEQLDKKHKAVVARWEKLTKAVLVKARLHARYVAARETPAPAAEPVVAGRRSQGCDHNFESSGTAQRCTSCGLERIAETI